MGLQKFDHVNIRTQNLDQMVAWYGDVLDLHPGPRPDFGFPGAWLYLGDQAYLHFVAMGGPYQAGGNATLEHFAFFATDMPEFLARLDARGVPYTVDEVPGFPVVQVNFFDPDGNHIHVDFDRAEYDGSAPPPPH